MTIEVTVQDSENQTWDFRSGLAQSEDLIAFGLSDGTEDTVDDGFLLRVNGVGINPQGASLDLGGRELNLAPVMVDGVAVSRSVLVSDADISSIGFARFLETFTNTTDEAVTVTVEIIINSGADGNLQFTGETSGDGSVSNGDTGFVTDDFDAVGNDSALMHAFGSGDTGDALISRSNDIITVTHTLTLQPGETQSLLHFGTQNVTSADGVLDLQIFTQDAPALDAANLLAGLSPEELLSIVNYSGFDQVVPAFSLTDSDGNRWGVDSQGRLSTLDSEALLSFQIPIFPLNYDETLSVTADPEGGEVTVVTGGYDPDATSTVTYTYTALEDLGVVRLLVTWAAGELPILGATLENDVMTGASPAILPSQAEAPVFNVTSGVVLDDSESGTGGTLPALTFVYGATGSDATSSASGSSFASIFPSQGVDPAVGPSQYLFFFALNDTGLEALVDLTLLNTPGFAALAGLSAAEVAAVRNFDLDEGDRLQTSLGTTGDDILAGHVWGDSIAGDGGDDEIHGFGSDDVLRGGTGNDILDGGDGADTVAGDDGGDLVLGGLGADRLQGINGQDTLLGGAGSDEVLGGSDLDRLFGNAGRDTLNGGQGNDTLEGGTGNDDLTGGGQADVFVFRGGHGSDRVLDFVQGLDRLDLSDLPLVAALGDLDIVTRGTKTVIDTGEGRITLQGFSGVLAEADFLF